MPSMRARDFAPVAPLETEPFGALTDLPQRREALLDALRKVELGKYDEKFLTWLLTRLDITGMRTLVSLLERTRAAGMADVLNANNAPRGPQGNARGWLSA